MCAMMGHTMDHGGVSCQWRDGKCQHDSFCLFRNFKIIAQKADYCVQI